MGTPISNDKLGIDFEVDELFQNDLEIYERGMSQYLKDSEFDGTSNAVLVSAVIVGAIDAKLIPSDVIANKEELLNSKPQKVSFLAAKIAGILDSTRNEEVNIEIDAPEITQGELEKYEKIRKKVIGDQELEIYEMAKANSIMVQIALELNWIPENVLKSSKDIPASKPNIIRYLANTITEALTEARTISGE